MQKATHDVDYLCFLTGERPVSVCAATAKLYYRGDRPGGPALPPTVPDYRTCRESSYVVGRILSEDVGRRLLLCEADTGNEDGAAMILTMESGMIVTYSQNFTVKKGAGRRGARLIGTDASAEFDLHGPDPRGPLPHPPDRHEAVPLPGRQPLRRRRGARAGVPARDGRPALPLGPGRRAQERGGLPRGAGGRAGATLRHHRLLRRIAVCSSISKTILSGTAKWLRHGPVQLCHPEMTRGHHRRRGGAALAGHHRAGESLLPGASLPDYADMMLGTPAAQACRWAVHFDHGFTPELVEEAISLGFTSVMYDCSMLSFEENVRRISEMAKKGHAAGCCSLEAEIGVGSNGSAEEDIARSVYTRPEDALRFAQESGCDALAVAIGTAHGVYARRPETGP